ncbi:MAG: AI-2E family transporter, partial [Clostridiales bacterium]
MDIFDKAFHITKSYLKAQLIMSGLTCLILAIGFYLLDVSLWFLWAFLLAIADIIPIVGTGIFIIPWSIICFLKDDPQLGGYLLLVYGILVIIRQIVEPFVVGKGIGLSPLWTFLAMMA